mgnify:CR=1 FL=1
MAGGDELVTEFTLHCNTGPRLVWFLHVLRRRVNEELRRNDFYIHTQYTAVACSSYCSFVNQNFDGFKLLITDVCELNYSVPNRIAFANR